MRIWNPHLSKALTDELRTLEERYFAFDRPVNFKGRLKLYPVNIEFYNEFLVCSSCCTLNKNDSAEGLTMTHLDYLVSKMEDEKEGPMWSYYFSRLMEMVFHIQNGVQCIDCKRVMPFREFAARIKEGEGQCSCPECKGSNFVEVIKYVTNSKTNRKELIIDGVTITSKDFDRLRQIILYQNLPDYKDDSWVNPEVRADYRQKQELLGKEQGTLTATLEKKIVCVASQTSYKIAELYELSIRKFIMLLTAVDDAMTYQASRIGLMTGLVSSKKPLEHWIYKHEGSLYGEAVTAEAYKDKINKA